VRPHHWNLNEAVFTNMPGASFRIVRNIRRPTIGILIVEILSPLQQLRYIQFGREPNISCERPLNTVIALSPRDIAVFTRPSSLALHFEQRRLNRQALQILTALGSLTQVLEPDVEGVREQFHTHLVKDFAGTSLRDRVCCVATRAHSVMDHSRVVGVSGYKSVTAFLEVSQVLRFGDGGVVKVDHSAFGLLPGLLREFSSSQIWEAHRTVTEPRDVPSVSIFFHPALLYLVNKSLSAGIDALQN
jgi:hypothetical protein